MSHQSLLRLLSKELIFRAHILYSINNDLVVVDQSVVRHLYLGSVYMGQIHIVMNLISQVLLELLLLTVPKLLMY